jgi:ribosomal protein S12 methylthiotransferase
MKRGGNRKEFSTLVDNLRRSIPEMTLRTSVIVGYPEETSEDFNELLSFCRDIRFDHLGVFRYSREEGTEAFDLADDVPEQIKEERERVLMEMQQGILHEKQKEKIGGEYELLCEGACEESDDLLTGRLRSQAPEIDGRVLINEGSAQAGEFVKVRITESHPYDLVGRIVGYVS